MTPFRISLLVTTFLTVVTPFSIAAAPAQCISPDKRDAQVQHLADEFGESRQIIALLNETTALEIYANEETGTWTMATLHANGMMCMHQAGGAYREVNEALPPAGEDG